MALHDWIHVGSLTALLFSLTLAPAAGAQVFFVDDPIQKDPDRVPLDREPEEYPVSDLFNALDVTIRTPGHADGPAPNVNTLGDVPASSWYEPRHYARPMTPAELARGPNTTGGPTGEMWTVVSIKEEGVTPGLTILDGRGLRYMLKFDGKKYPAMASAAEAITTKIFYALGYHVPENYITHFRPEQLVPDTAEGVRQSDIDELIDELTTYGDGLHRALASLFLAGVPIGPFTYYGRRSDDPNDLYPHEARRELRGMRLAAAWTDHFDSRAQNSLDMIVEREDGTGRYVRHHLIDFGTTLGGGALGPKRLWYGAEYAFELDAILARTVTLGIARSSWASHSFPDIPHVGFFDAEQFDPVGWKPGFPNPAFRRMDARDGFWMAKQIAQFDDTDIEAIVRTSEYPDETATRHVTETLAERRDQIADAYLTLGGGIDAFETKKTPGGTVLTFRELLPEKTGNSRTVAWHRFDNAFDAEGGPAVGPSFKEEEIEDNAVAVPDHSHEFMVAVIKTPGYGATRVFLRKRNPTPASGEATFEVVGIQRRSSDEHFKPGWG
ncbi:MAG: hypothetical protein WD205_07215 [Rhodothermales bacterium]